MELDDRQRALCDDHEWDFSPLRAMVVNCTLKPSPEPSHTDGLLRIPIAIGCDPGRSAKPIGWAWIATSSSMSFTARCRWFPCWPMSRR